MSLPIEVLKELFLAERDQSKVLRENVNQLTNEVERLRSELSSVRNDNVETSGEGRTVSENDEDTTESGKDLPECLEPQLSDTEDLYRNLQTTLNATYESNRVIQSTLDAANDSNRELCDVMSALQTTLDHAEWHRASGDDGDVLELQERLKEVQLELDHAEDYSMRRQSDLVAANETSRELRVANEQLQSKLDAACDTIKELSDRNDELRTDLNDAAQSEASEDGEYVRELEYSLRERQIELETANASNAELQMKNKLLEEQLDYVAEANWESMRPFLDKDLSKRYLTYRAKFRNCDTELSKVKEELSKTNADLLKSEATSAELQEENQALRRDLEAKSAELDALRKETSKPAAKGELSSGEREQLRLKDRQSLYHPGW